MLIFIFAIAIDIVVVVFIVIHTLLCVLFFCVVFGFVVAVASFS